MTEHQGPTEKPLPLFLADDRKIIRDGLHLLIDRNTNFRIVGEANAGATNTIRFQTNGQDLANMDQIVVITP